MFFGDADLQRFIASVGADMSVEPEIMICAAVAAPGELL